MWKVIVADDQEMYRAGVIALLSTGNAGQALEQYCDWLGLARAMTESSASIVVASISLVPDCALLIAWAQKTHCRVLLVADDSDSLSYYRSTGAAGVVHRGTSASVFLDTLRQIQEGVEFVVPADVTRKLELDPRLAKSLTPGELKILALLMEGFKNRRIAEYLHVAEHVVKSRFRKIFDKTGFSNRLELALFISHSR